MKYRQNKDCIFCKIVSGEISTPGIFWESDTHLAMLSINPNTEGFTVVIPKDHYDSDIMLMDDEPLQALILAAKEVAGILVDAFGDVGRVGVMMEGLGVNHAHVKLFPMHNTKELKGGKWKSFDTDKEFWFDEFEGWMSSGPGPLANDEDLKRLAQKIKDSYQK